jgi:enamine deaminase RidA (YjgF/YER057c/UK114 family)
MTRQTPSRTRPADRSPECDPPELRLQQHSWDQGYVTVAASMPRLPLDASASDIESSARRAIGSLIRRLRQAGGDPDHITRTSIGVRHAAHGAVLAAVRDKMLHREHAIHTIFLLNDGTDDAFVAEIDAAGLGN